MPEDAGKIVVTALHGALLGARPDNAVGPDVYACFFMTAASGWTGQGSRASCRWTSAVFGPVLAASAQIGDARALYHDGTHFNQVAAQADAPSSVSLKVFVDVLT